MAAVQYIFDRDQMKDPFDGSVWERLQVRTIKDERHAKKLLLDHPDCWAEVDEFYADPEEDDPAPKLNAKEREEKEDAEAGEPMHDLVGRMPRLESMSKAQMSEFAKREFNADLDPKMKAEDMRNRIKALVNGARLS